MAGRSKRKRSLQRAYSRYWETLREVFSSDRFRLGIRLAGWALVVGGVIAGVAVAAGRTERYVSRQLDHSVGRPTLVFPSLPSALESLARQDLLESASTQLDQPWTTEGLCRDLAASLSSCGWIEQVHAVRRTGNGHFAVDARYRIPVAMVSWGNGFILVDAENVRLPGAYLYDATWTIIEGVEEPPPQPGRRWMGDDIRAGVSIVSLLANEPFAHQVTAVLVDNVGGRTDSQRPQIELAMDRAGGRIRWGSAPGAEIAENTAQEKLAILRENFRQTGRADGNHLVIEIFTFADRFTFPG